MDVVLIAAGGDYYTPVVKFVLEQADVDKLVRYRATANGSGIVTSFRDGTVYTVAIKAPA